jgi:hypothetical protein
VYVHLAGEENPVSANVVVFAWAVAGVP